MVCLCRVNVVATLEDQSVHIEEAGKPDNLLFAVEDERGMAPVIHRAWRDFIKTRTCSIQSIGLHLGAAMPHERRNEALCGAISLLRRIIGQ